MACVRVMHASPLIRPLPVVGLCPLTAGSAPAILPSLLACWRAIRGSRAGLVDSTGEPALSAWWSPAAAWWVALSVRSSGAGRLPLLSCLCAACCVLCGPWLRWWCVWAVAAQGCVRGRSVALVARGGQAGGPGPGGPPFWVPSPFTILLPPLPSCDKASERRRALDAVARGVGRVKKRGG